LVDGTKEFLTIMEDPKFRRRFEGLHGEKLKRIPHGFPADHWMGEWLKYKSFYTGDEWDEDACYSPKFVDKIVGNYKELLPLVRFLNKALES